MRPDGSVGTRNYVGVIASVNCSASVCHAIADAYRHGALDAFGHVDGVVAITHQSGCGMSATGDGIELLRRTLVGYARNPNFAGVLLVGLGKQDAFNQKAYNDAATAAWRALLATKVVQVTFTLAQLPVDERSSDWGVRAAILALRNETYRFTQMKSKPEPASHTLKRVVFSVDPSDEKAAKVAVKQAVALANGMDLTRDLGN
ncbi:UxaA family hydrolase, partial [Ralstonia pickettii]|nr:UxaA family hydrolase [Ralstonia pickettii]